MSTAQIVARFRQTIRQVIASSSLPLITLGSLLSSMSRHCSLNSFITLNVKCRSDAGKKQKTADFLSHIDSGIARRNWRPSITPKKKTPFLLSDRELPHSKTTKVRHIQVVLIICLITHHLSKGSEECVNETLCNKRTKITKTLKRAKKIF